MAAQNAMDAKLALLNNGDTVELDFEDRDETLVGEVSQNEKPGLVVTDVDSRAIAFISDEMVEAKWRDVTSFTLLDCAYIEQNWKVELAQYRGGGSPNTSLSIDVLGGVGDREEGEVRVEFGNWVAIFEQGEGGVDPVGLANYKIWGGISYSDVYARAPEWLVEAMNKEIKISSAKI